MQTVERVAVGGFWGLVIGAAVLLAFAGGPRPMPTTPDTSPARLARMASTRCSYALADSHVIGGGPALLGCLESAPVAARRIGDGAP